MLELIERKVLFLYCLTRPKNLDGLNPDIVNLRILVLNKSKNYLGSHIAIVLKERHVHQLIQSNWMKLVRSMCCALGMIVLGMFRKFESRHFFNLNFINL